MWLWWETIEILWYKGNIVIIFHLFVFIWTILSPVCCLRICLCKLHPLCSDEASPTSPTFCGSKLPTQMKNCKWDSCSKLFPLIVSSDSYFPNLCILELANVVLFDFSYFIYHQCHALMKKYWHAFSKCSRFVRKVTV